MVVSVLSEMTVCGGFCVVWLCAVAGVEASFELSASVNSWRPFLYSYGEVRPSSN